MAVERGVRKSRKWLWNMVQGNDTASSCESGLRIHQVSIFLIIMAARKRLNKTDRLNELGEELECRPARPGKSEQKCCYKRRNSEDFYLQYDKT